MEGGGPSSRLTAFADLVDECRRYANLHAEIQDSTAEMRAIGAKLLERIPTTKSVTIAKNVVLAHITKPPMRRPITQTILKKVGMSEAMLSNVLKETAPDPDDRTHSLKVMVTSSFKAMRPQAKKRKLGSGASAVSESEEESE